jgi:sucrose phosphorylase
MAGVPGIYVHSLLGSGNDLEGLEALGYNRAINREKLVRSEVEAELENSSSRRAQVLNRFKHLLSIRKQNAAFSPSASQRIVQSGDKLITLVRGEEVAVAINISSQAVELDTATLLDGITHDLISGSSVNGSVTVQPYQVMWLTK